MAGTVCVLSLVTVFSFADWRDFYPLAAFGLDGMTPFDLIREGVSNFLLPAAGFAFALMIGWGLPRERVRKALPMDDGILFTVWYGVMRFVAPVAIAALFIAAFLGD